MTRAIDRTTCLQDVQNLARQIVPRMFYEYADSGSWTASTYRVNESDFARIKLRQRVAVNVDKRSTASTLIGQKVSAPLAISPTGLAGMQYPDGEIAAAQAAEEFGVPYTLSTMSICSIEDVAAATRAPFWFQLYMMRDRDFIESLLGRAGQAGCPVLMVTVDLPVLGQRHNDVRNGLSAPPKLTSRTIMDLASHPRWCLRMLRTKRRNFGNVVGHVKGVADVASLSEWISQQFDPRVTWTDFAWIRSLWKGKIIVKGVLDPDDARRAVDAGVDGLLVSNHGGRQLDGGASSISAVPAISAAVGTQTEIMLDGGVRSGADLFRARALGASGALIGRPHLYGLGAAGKPGVRRVLDILGTELDRTMALCGVTEVSQIGPDCVVAPSDWSNP